MKSADYNNQLFKQVQDLIDRCDSLSADMKRERKEHIKEMHELRAEHKKEISDIKKNIPNNREKNNKKAGGQKGHIINPNIKFR